MVLHNSNVEIPARFVFRPYRAFWLVGSAEVVGWWEGGYSLSSGGFHTIFARGSTPGYLPVPSPPERVILRLPRPIDETTSVNALGLTKRALAISENEFCEVAIDRADLPAGVLQSHEHRRNTPDITGRTFDLLICPTPEFGNLFPSLTPGDVAKNAWAMREEFFNLEDDIGSVCRFLNRWGRWKPQRRYEESVADGFGPRPLPLALEFPHIILRERDRYRRALVGSARGWLRTAGGLSISQIDEPPYFVMEQFSCAAAVHYTVTIDHLSGLKFGICKRCRKLFEHETQHKKNYCSRKCIQAAGVQRWRAKKKKESKRKDK
jgi:hypothetical protein